MSVRLVAPDDPVLEGADAAWDYGEDKAVISINQRLPIKRKRYLVIHELHHVVADYMHDVLDNHGDTVRP